MHIQPVCPPRLQIPFVHKQVICQFARDKRPVSWAKKIPELWLEIKNCEYRQKTRKVVTFTQSQDNTQVVTDRQKDVKSRYTPSKDVQVDTHRQKYVTSGYNRSERRYK